MAPTQSTAFTKTWRLAFGFTFFYSVCFIVIHSRLSYWQSHRTSVQQANSLNAALDDALSTANIPARPNVDHQILQLEQKHSISSISESISILGSSEDAAELDSRRDLLFSAIQDTSSTALVSAVVPHIYRVLQDVAKADNWKAIVEVVEEISRKGYKSRHGPIMVQSNNEPTFQDTLKNLLEQIGRSSVVILADDHNYEKLHDSFLLRDGSVPLIRVETNLPLEAARVAEHKDFIERATIVCVGGCACLDVCKAVAITGKDLVMVPTLLSTACISNNRSVLGLGAISFLASMPSKVVYNIDALASDDPRVVKKWTRAGVVEILVPMTGSIDNQYQLVRSCAGQEGMDLNTILAVMPHARKVYDSLPWFETSFTGEFDHNALLQIAKYIHEEGIDTVDNGTNERPGGEHGFYRAIIKLNPSLRHGSLSHGAIVSFGILISLKIFAIQWGDDSVYARFRRIFHKLDIPLTYSGLMEHGLTRDLMIKALTSIRSSEDFGQYIIADCIDTTTTTSGSAVMDAVFADP